MRAIVKCVIKSVKKEWFKDKWGSTSYNVLGMQPTSHVFNMVYLGACKNNHMPFPSRPANPFNHSMLTFIKLRFHNGSDKKMFIK